MRRRQSVVLAGTRSTAAADGTARTPPTSDPPRTPPSTRPCCAGSPSAHARALRSPWVRTRGAAARGATGRTATTCVVAIREIVSPYLPPCAGAYPASVPMASRAVMVMIFTAAPPDSSALKVRLHRIRASRSQASSANSHSSALSRFMCCLSLHACTPAAALDECRVPHRVGSIRLPRRSHS